MVTEKKPDELSARPGQQARVLLVDDDPKITRLLSNYLEQHGYRVTVVHEGNAAVAQLAAETWDLVILDVMLPGIDGFELLKEIRSRWSVPVVMLTARGEEADRIVGLEIGADDYVSKTSSSRELLARIRALLRRSQGLAVVRRHNEIVCGELRVNPESHQVFMAEAEVMLTLIEFDLLLSLGRSKGKVMTREQLIGELRGEGKLDVNERTIDVHISLLRRKLGDSRETPRYIRTIRGVGYMLINPNSRAL